MKTELHCGACMTNFEKEKELSDHIATCPAARIILPVVHAIYAGKDKTGHQTAHFLRLLHDNAHLIKRYASAIATELDTISRSEIHSELCNKLGLDYKKFRPFESSSIREMPSLYEAELILWDALGVELRSHLKDK